MTSSAQTTMSKSVVVVPFVPPDVKISVIGPLVSKSMNQPGVAM